jgi:hypothetical protein
MKRNFIILLFAFLIISTVSCKKDDSSTTPVVPSDPYNFTVTNSKEAFVLITTATWCKYCWQWGVPAFEVAMTGQEGIDKTKVNGCALHYSSSDPLFLELSNTIKTGFGIGGPPNLWIECDNGYNLDPTGWKAAIKTKQTGTSVCGIGLNKVISGNSYKVYIKVKFFTPQSGTYNLAVYAVENGKVSNQTTMTGSDPNFIHNQILRAEITNNTAWGTQLFNGASQSTEYKYTYTYTPATGVNISNIKFVGVVYKMNGGIPIGTPNSNTN